MVLINANKGKYPVEAYSPFQVMQSMVAIFPKTFSSTNNYAEYKSKLEERDTQEMEYMKSLFSMQNMAYTMFERNKEGLKNLR